MKRVLITGLTVAFCLLSGTAAFAETPVTPYDQKSSEKFIIEKYDELFEKNGGNNDAAIEELISNSDSLSLISHEESIYLNGEAISPLSRTEVYDLILDDYIIHDSDWGTYVYIGTWDWHIHPSEPNLHPMDLVAIYSQNSAQIRARESIVYGYNLFGSRVFYYNTDSHQSTGPIQKMEDGEAYTVYWFDETGVDNGRIVAPLYYTSGSTARMLTAYNHTYTTTNITGVGGEVSFDGAGLSIDWETGVQHWNSCATSPGARIPGVQ